VEHDPDDRRRETDGHGPSDQVAAAEASVDPGLDERVQRIELWLLVGGVPVRVGDRSIMDASSSNLTVDRCLAEQFESPAKASVGTRIFAHPPLPATGSPQSLSPDGPDAQRERGDPAVCRSTRPPNRADRARRNRQVATHNGILRSLAFRDDGYATRERLQIFP
jgi:hypothetical protein